MATERKCCYYFTVYSCSHVTHRSGTWTPLTWRYHTLTFTVTVNSSFPPFPRPLYDSFGTRRQRQNRHPRTTTSQTDTVDATILPTFVIYLYIRLQTVLLRTPRGNKLDLSKHRMLGTYLLVSPRILPNCKDCLSMKHTPIGIFEKDYFTTVCFCTYSRDVERLPLDGIQIQRLEFHVCLSMYGRNMERLPLDGIQNFQKRLYHQRLPCVTTNNTTILKT